MEGHSVISPEVLARYAADAAAEVPGVHTQAAPRRAVSGRGRGARRDRLRREHSRGGRRGAEAGDRVPRADGGRQADVGRRGRRRRPATAVATRIAGLTKLTLETAPSCATSASGGRRAARRTLDKDRWMEKIELDFGACGTVYYDADGRVLGSMQYGPCRLFPRAGELPGGPPSDDSMLVTCAYLADRRARGCCSRSSWPRSARLATAARRARGVLLPLPRGRVGLRAVPRAQDGVPRRFPRRLRLPGGALRRARRPLASRARRAAARRRGHARQGVARGQGRVWCAEGVPSPIPRQP